VNNSVATQQISQIYSLKKARTVCMFMCACVCVCVQMCVCAHVDYIVGITQCEGSMLCCSYSIHPVLWFYAVHAVYCTTLL